VSENPYIGLQPFELRDRDRFFGRTADCVDVRSLWLANRLLVVYGASGAGKTSLIQAGVIPLFLTTGPDRDATVLPVGRLPQGSAYPTAASERSPHHEAALISSWAAGEQAPRSLSMADFLESVPVEVDRYGDELPLMAVIDQFEELFVGQRDRAAEWDGFLHRLQAAIERVPRLHVLVAIREEYVADLLPYETAISGHSRARFRVRALDPDGALAAVTGPLRDSGRTFGPGAAEALVADLRTLTTTNAVGETIQTVSDRIEPIQLQVVCSALWKALPDSVTEITSEHLRESGDVDQMLLDFCREAVYEVALDHRAEERTIWTWLSREFVTDTGRRGTVYEGVTTTAGMSNEIAWSLESHRVLGAEERLGSWWFELLHDRLIGAVQEGARLVTASESIAEDLPRNYLRTAESALADGDAELSEKYALQGLRRFAETALYGQAEARSLLGRIAEARDDSADAERNYRLAEQIYEQAQDERAVGRLQLELGRLFGRRGDLLAAQTEYERALRGKVVDIDVRVELARLLRRMGSLGAALSHLGTALTLDPSCVPALIERGLTYDAMGDRAAALADLADAMRLRPSVADRDDVRRVLEAGSSA
jgi:tetratricopeptide (TPR) repeat protein